MNLQGKTAVITGCLQGIGRSALDLFAANGANVFACVQVNTDEFSEHASQLEKQYGVRIMPVAFDMASNDSIKSAVREIQKEKLPVDILVNIAGIAKDSIFPMVTLDQMQEVFQINFFSQIVLSQYISKLMLRQGRGSIIFTSSITALDGNFGQLVYGASKAALIAAMKTMAIELGPKGVRVNAVAPGVIKTPMTEALIDNLLLEKMERSSLKRYGSPEEVAELLLFLASDESTYITGQTIRVDGGIG